MPASSLAFADSGRTRLTYVMLFRVGLVTLLLASALAAEVGATADEQTSPVVSLSLIHISEPTCTAASRSICRTRGNRSANAIVSP